MSTEPDREGTWQPKILAFVCRWCTYAGADLAGTSRLKYPPEIRIIKLPCSGRIDPLFLLRAFAMGADGVLVSGCHPGDCHYTSGNYIARRRWILFHELMDLVGLDPRRVRFSWVSAAEGAKFVSVVKETTAAVRAAGPFLGFAPPGDSVAPGPLRRKGAERPFGPIAEIAAARADVEGGVVKAVLGYRQGRRAGRYAPVWAVESGDLGRLLYGPVGGPALVTHLVRRCREDAEGTYGIVGGPREIAALDRLFAERQLDPARVRIYRQEGDRPAPVDGERWKACGVPALDRPAEERWGYWTAQFARCLRCNACREACSLCSCLRCVQEKSRPRWIDSSPTPAGNWIWNVTRAFHLAGRCVGCGACEEACPVGIPLGALNLAMIQAAERRFGSRSPEARSPLLAYEISDEAPFIL